MSVEETSSEAPPSTSSGAVGEVLVRNPAFKEHPVWAWWLKSTLRAVLRKLLGITDDCAAGERYMTLTNSNIIQLSRLIKGLRADVDASTKTQNPVNAQVAELTRRLVYYESKVGTRLWELKRELDKLDAEAEQERRTLLEENERKRLLEKPAPDDGEGCETDEEMDRTPQADLERDIIAKPDLHLER